MAKEPQDDLGQFAAGEIPPPLYHTFRDFNGDPVDLSGFDVVTMQMEADVDVAGPLGAGTVQIVDVLLGRVKYQWSATDMASPATYRAQLWVWDENLRRYASDVFKFIVYDGPGEHPV